MTSFLFSPDTSFFRRAIDKFRKKENIITDRQILLEQVIKPYDAAADASRVLRSTHPLVKKLIQEFNLPSIQKYSQRFNDSFAVNDWVLCGHHSSREGKVQIDNFGGVLGTPEVETLYSSDYLLRELSGKSSAVMPGRVMAVYLAPYYAVMGYAPNISLKEFNPSLTPQDLPIFYRENAAAGEYKGNLEQLFKKTHILPNVWRIAEVEF